MEEIKKFKILPDDEERVIQEKANFRWTYVSSQEINYTTSSFERRGFTIYNDIIKENYVNLVLRRDTEMNNYLEIKKLEHKYDSLAVSYPGNNNIIGNIILVGCLALGISTIIYSLVAFAQNVLCGIFVLICAFVFILCGIVIKIEAMKRDNEAMREAEENYNKLKA